MILFKRNAHKNKWSKKDLFWRASMTGWMASKNMIELDELMNEQMNKWTNELITEWVNEWMNEWVNILNNEWLNESSWRFNLSGLSV